MSQMKYAICLASYSIGNATENSELLWLGNLNWVQEFDEAEFFSEKLAAESALLREQIHGVDSRSLSIVQVLCSDYSD